MEGPLKHLVDDLEGNPVAAAGARRQIYEMWKQEPEHFSRAIIDVLKSDSDREGYKHLLRFLIDHGLLYSLLGDTADLSLEQAIAIGRCAQKMDPQIDAKLGQLVVTAPEGRVSLGFNAERAFQVAIALTSGVCLLPILVQLLRSPNSRIRSRAALLVGRMAASARPMEGVLSGDDGRVRANAVEALWGLRSPDAEAVFRSASQSTENRTAGNGLIGLYKMGDVTSIGQILERARDPEPRWRATAVWAMGASGDPRFVATLKTMLTDPEPSVRRNVLTALARIKRNTDQLLAGERLRLCLCPPRAEAECLRAEVAVMDANGASVGDLPATRFIVWRDGAPVPEFEVRERKAGGPITIAFGSSVLGNSSHPLYKSCMDTLTTCLKLSRDVDRWLLTEIRPGAKGVFRARPPRDILRALESGEGVTACDDLFDAASLALGAMSDARGSRHVVLVGAPPPSREIDIVGQLLKLARDTRTTIHAVSLGLSSEIATLCRRTGGSLLTAMTAEGIPALAEGLYVSMLHCYQITLTAPGSKVEDIEKVEVYSDTGHGEAVLNSHSPAAGAEKNPVAAQL